MSKITIKLCKDCQYSRRDLLLGWASAKCRTPENSSVSSITGKPVYYNNNFCVIQRSSPFREDCGMGAQFFKQATTPKFFKFLGF